MVILFILAIVCVSIFIFGRIVYNKKKKKSFTNKIIIKDTLAEVKKCMNSLFRDIREQKFSNMYEYCTDKFINYTDKGKRIHLDYNSVALDYYVEKDYQDSVQVILMGKCYEIRNNIVKFVRLDNILKIDEVL